MDQGVLGTQGQLSVVATFEAAGDRRVESMGRCKAGEFVLCEEVSGPSALISFGADARRMEVVVKDENSRALLKALKALYPVTSVAEYLQQEDTDLLDLMDLCDREEIPYGYSCIDSNEDGWVRPACA